jgi:hypothetical protein
MIVMPTVAVSISVYPLVTGPLLHARARAVREAVRVGRGIYILFAEVVVAAAVPNESIVMTPLTTPGNQRGHGFLVFGKSHVMFVQLHEKPQQFMTYGHCLGYSAVTVDLLLAIEKVLKFTSVTN